MIATFNFKIIVERSISADKFIREIISDILKQYNQIFDIVYSINSISEINDNVSELFLKLIIISKISLLNVENDLKRIIKILVNDYKWNLLHYKVDGKVLEIYQINFSKYWIISFNPVFWNPLKLVKYSVVY